MVKIVLVGKIYCVIFSYSICNTCIWMGEWVESWWMDEQIGWIGEWDDAWMDR